MSVFFFENHLLLIRYVLLELDMSIVRYICPLNHYKSPIWNYKCPLINYKSPYHLLLMPIFRGLR